MWSSFNGSPYVHSPLLLQWHRWTVYCITCDIMEAVVFSPCLTHEENVHNGRFPVFDCKLANLCHKWKQTPKQEEVLLLRFNYNLNMNPKHWHLQMTSKHPVCWKWLYTIEPWEEPQKKTKLHQNYSGTDWNYNAGWLKLCTGLFLSVLNRFKGEVNRGTIWRWNCSSSHDDLVVFLTQLRLGFIHPRLGKKDMTSFKHICCCL